MKKIFIIGIILVLILSAAIVYLNNVLLPKKVKTLIINTIEEQTQKKVLLDSVSINIFKGLVLRNLTIYDDKETFLKVKEASCTVLLLPVFKKRIIIPTLWLKSPVISLVRRQDNTFNIQDLFPKKIPSEDKPGPTPPPGAGTGYSILLYWLKITDGTIRFQDNTFAVPFTKNIAKLHLSMHLSMPAGVKFALKSQIPSAVPINLNAAGEFRFRQQQLIARILLQNLSPKEFSNYYQDLNISIPEGLISSLVNLKLANNTFSGDLEAQNKNLNILKDKVLIQLNSQLKANFQFSLKDKRLGFSGKAAVTDSKVLGINFAGPIDDISGDITFNDSGIYSNNLNAKIWGLPIKSKASLTDFSDALLNINMFSDMTLGEAQRLLKEKLNFTLPADLRGQGSLYLGLQTKFAPNEALEIHGWLDIINGVLKFKKIPDPLEGMRGRLEFERNQLKWANLNFTYQGVPYNSKCIITDFKSPGVQFMLSSDDLTLDSVFAVNNRLVKLAKLDGKYLNSAYSVTGDINTENLPDLQADISGELEIELQDIKKPLSKFKDKIEKINPQGQVSCQFRLNGNITDLKSCGIEAKFISPEVSVYGLKGKEFYLNYSQEEGLINIPLMHMSLYDGTLDASASINLNSQDRPYWVSAGVKDVKIEKLKLDTPEKDKDVSGTMQAQATVSGASGDISKLSGGGKISITEGKLWQLNLFKGLGALLFTKDFTNIVFREGQCSFIINDKFISTDKLVLRSNIVDLVGPVKIGFDNSIRASLDVQVVDEMVPLSGSFRDVTTAIVGQAGRFGVIELSGTIKDPKYKFKTAVQDIIKGLKNAIFH